MRNWLIILILLLNTSLLAQDNVTPESCGNIANATTAFGVNISVGQQIFEVDTKQLFLCTAATNSSETLTTAASKFSALAPIDKPVFTGTPIGIGLPVYVSVSGLDVTTTGQTLVDITGLSVTLSPNASYEFEAVLGVSTSAVTTGCEYGVNGPTGSTVTAVASGSYTATASAMARITAINTPTGALLTTSSQSGGVIIKGIITTKPTAGNITIKHLKVTSGTSTVFIGSSLKVTRIN
jgi:molybdenum cofactor biosynthesis enzyme